jgi:hypothetical protein
MERERAKETSTRAREREKKMFGLVAASGTTVPKDCWPLLNHIARDGLCTGKAALPCKRIECESRCDGGRRERQRKSDEQSGKGRADRQKTEGKVESRKTNLENTR